MSFAEEKQSYDALVAAGHAPDEALATVRENFKDPSFDPNAGLLSRIPWWGWLAGLTTVGVGGALGLAYYPWEQGEFGSTEEEHEGRLHSLTRTSARVTEEFDEAVQERDCAKALRSLTDLARVYGAASAEAEGADDQGDFDRRSMSKSKVAAARSKFLSACMLPTKRTPLTVRGRGNPRLAGAPPYVLGAAPKSRAPRARKVVTTRTVTQPAVTTKTVTTLGRHLGDAGAEMDAAHRAAEDGDCPRTSRHLDKAGASSAARTQLMRTCAVNRGGAFGATADPEDRALALKHLEAARHHLAEESNTEQGSMAELRHHDRAMAHLGRYNQLMREELRAQDIQPTQSAGSAVHRAFVPHDFDQRLLVRSGRPGMDGAPTKAARNCVSEEIRKRMRHKKPGAERKAFLPQAAAIAFSICRKKFPSIPDKPRRR